MANLTLLAGGALVSPPGDVRVYPLDGFLLRFCVVRELITDLEGLGAWRAASLLANAGTQSSSPDGGDDADEDDTGEDKDDAEFRTRLLPIDA